MCAVAMTRSICASDILLALRTSPPSAAARGGRARACVHACVYKDRSLCVCVFVCAGVFVAPKMLKMINSYASSDDSGVQRGCIIRRGSSDTG